MPSSVAGGNCGDSITIIDEGGGVPEGAGASIGGEGASICWKNTKHHKKGLVKVTIFTKLANDSVFISPKRIML